MLDIDCDDFGIDSAMRRATRIRWVNSRTVPYVAHDSDDCAPGLESIYDAMAAAADRETPCPKCGSPGGPFTGFGLAGGGFGFYSGCSDCSAFEKHQTTDELPDDVDCDRPSPGDDITHAAFDAMGGYRRSDDSSGGGIP